MIPVTCDQTYHLFYAKSTQLLQWSLETTSAFQTMKPNLNTIEDSYINEEFMDQLLQMEDGFSTEICLDNANGSNSSSPVSKENEENLVISMEDSHHVGDRTLTDLLLTGAKAVEASNWSLASDMIAQISNILLNVEDEDTPFNHIVFYLTQGLHYKCSNATEILLHDLVPTRKDNMSTFRMLVELSPYMKFAQFTANQAIFEATEGENEVHVVDFDIMEGIQWPALMADLAQRKGVSMRLTAIVGEPENVALIQLTGKRLAEFAASVGLPFRFDQMFVEKEEDFDTIEVEHTVIANCMIHQLHMTKRNFSWVKTFLNGVNKLPLKMIVLVEEELFNFAKVPSVSFAEFVSEAIQHYSAVSDSLVHSFTSVGFRLFEKEIMGRRVLDCMRNFPIQLGEKMLWDNSFSSLKGFKPVPMSTTNVSQAKLLMSLFGRGYWVQHENCRLSLCWKSQPLTTASIWMPRYTTIHPADHSDS